MEVNPSCSITADELHDEFDSLSVHSAVAKRQLKDAFVHCMKILEEEDMIDTQSSGTIPAAAKAIGEHLYNYTIQMLGEKKLVLDEDLIHCDEQEDEHYCEVEEENVSSDEQYEPEEKKSNVEYIPLSTKIKVVRLSKEHPTWSLKTLQMKGSRRLTRKDDLTRWEENIINGGTTIDKYALIDSWTYDRFSEARNNCNQVTTRNLQQWALAAAAQFQCQDNFSFAASTSWVTIFKRRHRIRQRKITKFVSNKEVVSMEEILQAARNFQLQTTVIIPQFDKRFVINTDQTGCQYQSTYDRTLTNIGEKIVTVKGNMNKVSHSYTAQYAITLSGELLPHVFLCLQEPTGHFGPRIQKSVDDLMKAYPNVVVTCSKSGKLTTEKYIQFLNTVMHPYVGKEKFLLIVDSWGGQTNPSLYDEIFIDDVGHATCTLKIIPAKCTPICQPCDVYFYRQVKNFMKRLQTCSYLLENDREINKRDDIIKIHSIIHNQLSAPAFGSMLRYAWYASKLSDNREFFSNVNDISFPTDTLKISCACGKTSLVKCSRCRCNLCFECLYDKYHPEICNGENTTHE